MRLQPYYASSDRGPAWAKWRHRPSLLEVLEKQLGKPAADALVKSFFDNVVSANTELSACAPISAICRTNGCAGANVGQVLVWR
jgi:hypothetical protein